jgi:hypothetical protein
VQDDAGRDGKAAGDERDEMASIGEDRERGQARDPFG